MTSAPVGGSQPTGTQLAKKSMSLSTDDFIKMMITQLQNQDPMQPASNQELLAQMSQIGQLQSANTLQDAIKGMVLQSQLSGAGNLIGKAVVGLDENSRMVQGIVTSVRVAGQSVNLELDSGQSLALDHVTQITTAPASPAGPTGS